MVPKLAKPPGCQNCSLNGIMAQGTGYAPAIGPTNAALLFKRFEE